jgi:hypothetical protein
VGGDASRISFQPGKEDQLRRRFGLQNAQEVAA